MSPETNYLPLGPYKAYEQIGLPPEPKQEQRYVDTRTGVPYGEYKEEDILENLKDVYSTATIAQKPEPVIYPMVQLLKDRMDAEPDTRILRTSIKDAIEGHWKQTLLSVQASQAASKYGETKDPRYLQEANDLSEQATKVAEEFPAIRRNSILDKLILGSVDALGSMTPMWGEMAKSGLAGTAVGGAIAGPWGAGAIGGLGATGGAMSSVNDLERGGMFLEMVNYVDPVTGAKIDEDIAWRMAYGGGIISTIFEGISLGKAISVAPILKNTVRGKRLLKFVEQVFKTGVTEDTTEGLQEITAIAAVERAKRLTAEKTGAEFSPVDWNQIRARIGQAQEAGWYGGLGLSLISGMAGIGLSHIAPVKVSEGSTHTEKSNTDARRLIQQRSEREATQAERKRALADKKIDEELAKVAQTKTPVAAVDPESGKRTQQAKETEEEIVWAKARDGVPEVQIKDEDIDSLILDEAGEDQATDSLVQQAQSANSERTGAFFTELHSLLPLEQADAAEAVLQARAETLGLTVDDYLEQRGLILDTTSMAPDEVTKAVTDFTDETQTVIRAFSNADVSSIVHELGHVFRRDIGGKDLEVLEDWLGIKHGSVWGRAEEERFAQGWEGYLASGKAPSKELVPLFQKFTRWMKDIYKGVKNLEEYQKIPDEVRQVFDRLLVNDKTVEPVQKDLVGVAEKLLYQKTPEQTAKEMAAEQKAAELTEIESLKQQIKVLAKKARQAMIEGDKQGFERAKAQIKARLQRGVIRSRLKARHKAVKKLITRKIKTQLPKKVQGQLKSRVSNDVRKELEHLYELISSVENPKQARIEYQRRIAAFGYDEVESVDMRLLHALSYVEQDSVDSLEQLNKDITDLINTGKADGYFGKMLAWKAKAKKLAFADILGEGQTLSPEVKKHDAAAVYRNKSWKERIKTGSLGSDFIFGLRGILDIISGNSSFGTRESFLNREFEVFDLEEKRATEVRVDNENAIQWYNEAFGLKGQFSAMRALHRDAIPNIDFAGGKYSRDTLRYMWLLKKDPTLTARMEYMGFSKKELAQLDALLTPEDKQYARSILGYFNSDENFQRTSDVYEMINGAPLDRRGLYVPAITEGPAVIGEGDSIIEGEKTAPQFTRDFIVRASAETSNRIKMRTETEKVRLKFMNLTSVMRGYSSEMAHFRNFAEMVRKMNALFLDQDIRDAIVSEYGEAVYSELLKNIRATAQNGKDVRDNIAWVDRIRSAFIVSKIGLGIPTFIKQQISIVNYLELMPVRTFFKNASLFFEDFEANVRSMENMEYIKNLDMLLERDLRDLMASPEYHTFLKDPQLLNLITLMVRSGNKMPQIWGGWAYRKYLMSKEGGGLTRAAAERKVGLESSQTQQSGMTSEQSSLQRGNSFVKLLTMWSSGPVQATRREMEATRGVLKGRMTKKQFLKTMLIYHVLIPQTYSVVGNSIGAMGGNDWDWLDHKITLAFGPLGNMYTVFSQLKNLARYIFGGSYYPASSPFSDTVHNISKVGRKMADDNFESITADEYADMIEGLLILGGQGLPVVRGRRMVEGAAELATGDLGEGVVHLMGHKTHKKKKKLNLDKWK